MNFILSLILTISSSLFLPVYSHASQGIRCVKVLEQKAYEVQSLQDLLYLEQGLALFLRSRIDTDAQFYTTDYPTAVFSRRGNMNEQKIEDLMKEEVDEIEAVRKQLIKDFFEDLELKSAEEPFLKGVEDYFSPKMSASLKESLGNKQLNSEFFRSFISKNIKAIYYNSMTMDIYLHAPTPVRIRPPGLHVATGIAGMIIGNACGGGGGMLIGAAVGCVLGLVDWTYDGYNEEIGLGTRQEFLIDAHNSNQL